VGDGVVRPKKGCELVAVPVKSARENARDVAEFYDVATQTVSAWCKRGCPHKREKRGTGARYTLSFKIEDVDGWLREKCKGPYDTSTRSMSVSQKTEAAEKDGTSDEEPKALRDKKDYWLAKKYEIQVKKERGELIPLEEVRQERLQRIEAVRAGLFSLPARLSGVCAGRSETEIQDEIESAINDLLERFAADG
jgi:phage terminase Nu1 subunit (DNA packaging protein)